MSTLRDIERLVKSFNNAREKAIKEIGDEDIYLDKSSTVIGCRESIEPMSIVSTDCKEIVVEQGSERYHFEGEEDVNGEMWYNIIAFEEDVKFMKHCIKNGVKAYQSEDEDKFASTNDEDCWFVYFFILKVFVKQTYFTNFAAWKCQTLKQYKYYE